MRLRDQIDQYICKFRILPLVTKGSLAALYCLCSSLWAFELPKACVETYRPPQDSRNVRDLDARLADIRQAVLSLVKELNKNLGSKPLNSARKQYEAAAGCWNAYIERVSNAVERNAKMSEVQDYGPMSSKCMEQLCSFNTFASVELGRAGVELADTKAIIDIIKTIIPLLPEVPKLVKIFNAKKPQGDLAKHLRESLWPKTWEGAVSEAGRERPHAVVKP